MEMLIKSFSCAPRLLGLSCTACASHVAHVSTTSQQQLQQQQHQQQQQQHVLQQQRRINKRTELDFEELMALKVAGDIALIDVRHPQELEKHDSIPGAVNIPLCHLKVALALTDEEWSREFGGLEKPCKGDRNLVFYARGPNASSAAVEIAHRLGFKRSRHYTGGWEDYCRRTGTPLTKAQQDALQHHYNATLDQYFL